RRFSLLMARLGRDAPREIPGGVGTTA
ncbi:MAG: hypothetical protein QOH07_3322, partial [Mycobacterium sp.]|nr:hypothetical protein [Mycobacterium sp.]